MAAMTRRKTTKSSGKPKEAPEPDTFVCEGAITAASEKDSVPMLGKCTKCKVMPTIKPLFAWYDMWIGCFWDGQKKRLYVFPVPCLGVVIQF